VTTPTAGGSVEPPLSASGTAAHAPRAAVGYALLLTGTVLFALNGTVVKSILLSGVSATTLSETRAMGAFVILVLVVALTRPSALRIRRDEWKLLLAYGVIGVSMTQFLYFVAIERMPIGIALIIEFTAPIWVVLWVRFGRKQTVRGTVWVGLLLAVIGLALIAQVWQGFTLDGLGVAAAFGAAIALALFYILGEHARRGDPPRDAISLTMWGMGGAALFWLLVPPWSFSDWSIYSEVSEPLAGTGPQLPLWVLSTWMVVMGTVVPFALAMKSLAYITAAQASIVGMTEPLIASIIAWIALSEVLTPVQIAGGAVVLVGVYLAERSR
jgi:drug/metabolite transporter (DMT)-like permease